MEKDKDNISPEEVKMLQESLLQLKSDIEKSKEKAEAKLWKNITVPLKLADSLAHLTKSDLDNIRRHLELKNISSLNKADLIDRLQYFLPKLIELDFQRFDSDRYRLIKSLTDAGGWISAPDDLTGSQLRFLTMRSIIAPGIIKGQRILAIPEEYIAVFKKMDNSDYQHIIRQNDEIIQISTGMLFYYGVMSISELYNKVRQYCPHANDFLRVIQILQDAGEYYHDIRVNNGLWCNSQVFDYKQVIREHNMRPDLDFYPFTHKQLLKAGKPGFIGRGAAYQDMVGFITENYAMSREEADAMVEECVYAIQIGEPMSNIMEFLSDQLEIPDLDFMQMLSDYVIKLNNNTRQWILKGYTPMEVVQQDNKLAGRPLPKKAQADIYSFKTRKKVGRNDPCPCGSGLKYKKCCGSRIDN